MNEPNKLNLPDGLVSWIAKWDGNCSQCGRRIRQRARCLYDKLERKLVCTDCVPKLSDSTSRSDCTANAAVIMDRIKVLLVQRKPLEPGLAAELKNLAQTLRYSFSGDYSARRLLIEVYRLKTSRTVLCVENEHAQKCHRCGMQQQSGWAVMWDKAAHRLWCLDCD